MPSFLTQCPHCLTPFRVTETQLEAADGLVRCGACLGIFSAAANRITLKQTPEEAGAPDVREPEDESGSGDVLEEVPGDAEEVPVPTPPAEEIPVAAAPPEPVPVQPAPAPPFDPELLDQDLDIPMGDFNLDSDEAPEVDEEEYEEDAFDDDEEDEEDEFEDDEEEEAPPRAPVERITTDKTELRRYLAEIEDDDALEPLDDEALDAFDEPVTLAVAPRRSRLAGVALLLANLVLVAILALQYTQANLETLRQTARFAPVLPYVCRLLDCPAVERSQLGSLVTEQLVVRSHPRYAQALEVSLVFRNDATEAQPFPAIELGFSDSSGRLLANRLFQPAEYLPNELQTSEMPPQSSLQVPLEMADPGSEAVNYTLVFRKP